MKIIRALIFLFVAGGPSVTVANAGKDTGSCGSNISVQRTSEYLITADDRVVKILQPHFFGFNIEWIGFQEDLWDSNLLAVKPEVISALQAIPGAVYRYPGGTLANHFDWRASLGPYGSRPLRRAVNWRGPLITHFGFYEYLDFVATVGGQSWIVPNLYGDFIGETGVSELTSQAGQWAAAALKSGAKVLRWELGNELDRNPYQWPPEKYSARALEVAKEIRVNDPSSRFVSFLQDYDAQPRITASAYNTITSKMLESLAPDHALHLYYDGAPGGPPIPNRLRHLCGSSAVIQAAVGYPAKIWVTEHARWPAGKSTDSEWKKNWYKTNNLEGALSVADMVIALSQIPNVEGAFLHSLAGTSGPWPLFHRTSSGLRPSAVYWGLRVLRDSMLDHVLVTQTNSRNDSGYTGSYDIRASLLTNSNRSKFVLWAVNRTGKEGKIGMSLSMLAGKNILARLITLSDTNPEANNTLDGQRILPRDQTINLTFVKGGWAMSVLPP